MSYQKMAAIFSFSLPNIISDSNVFTYLLLVLAALFTILWFYTKSSNNSPPLPPGPVGLPFLGSLPFLDPELHSYFATLAQTYGPIYKLRLGFKLGIVISSPSFARQVLKDHDVTFANRDVPDVGRSATYGGLDIAWAPFGPEWRMLRKVCVNKMLSKTTLDSVYSLRRREFRETVGFLYSQAGSPVNVGEQMFLTILNVITGMLWGGTVKGEQRASLGAEFRHRISEMTEILGKPNISDFFPGLTRVDLQGLRKKMDVLVKSFDRIFDSMIDQRMKNDEEIEGGEENKDFLQFLLKLKDEEDVKPPLTILRLKALLMVC